MRSKPGQCLSPTKSVARASHPVAITRKTGNRLANTAVIAGPGRDAADLAEAWRQARLVRRDTQGKPLAQPTRPSRPECNARYVVATSATVKMKFLILGPGARGGTVRCDGAATRIEWAGNSNLHRRP